MNILKVSAVALMTSTLMWASPMNFSEVDANGDGSITSEEFNIAKSNNMQKNYEDGKMLKNAANSLTFEQIDTNSDGKITKEELAIKQNERMKERISEKQQNKGQKGQKGNKGQKKGQYYNQ